MSLPPFRKVDFLPIRLEVERRQDGAIILRNKNPMGEPPPNLLEPLRRHAEENPERIWLAQRPRGPARAGVWQELAYREGWEKTCALAAALAARGLGEGQSLMVLSGNSIAHALVNYAAIMTGAAVVPVSEGWSLMSSDYAKLRHAFNLIKPSFVFVEDCARFAPALAAVEAEGIPLITTDDEPPSGALRFDDMIREHDSAAAAKLYDALRSDMVAKYLFTSGSTGMPKAVITTQRMMCLNAVMAEKLVIRKEEDPPPCMLNWLPWNHVYGGTSILNNLLTMGGTLYIDRGRPLPGRFEETLLALRDVAPTSYSNVPVAYGWLAGALERDDELAQHFFSRLRSMAYGGAALGQEMADRIQNTAIRITGERILFTSGYGATETAPTIMTVHWETEQMGLLGLPLPGVDIKLQPNGNKMEVCAKSDCITPGYYKDAEKTAAAFDEEGFYRLGDAAKFVDEQDPAKGLVFDGRVVEDFKLATGVWVSAGPLRLAVIDAAAPLIRDAVITGLDKECAGALIFPDFAALRQKAQAPASTPPESLITHPAVREHLAQRFAAYNAKQKGSSTRIGRIVLLVEPPDADKGEITDKGYINQAATLASRADKVAALYQQKPDDPPDDSPDDFIILLPRIGV